MPMTADQFHDFAVKFSSDVDAIATKLAVLDARDQVAAELQARPGLRKRIRDDLDARRYFPSRRRLG